LSAVWACVTVISKALASCVWDIYREAENGDREPRRGVRAYELLNVRANPECSAFSFKEALFMTAPIYGNFYAEIVRDMAGRPTELWPLETERCTLERDDFDRLVVVVRQRRGG